MASVKDDCSKSKFKLNVAENAYLEDMAILFVNHNSCYEEQLQLKRTRLMKTECPFFLSVIMPSAVSETTNQRVV